jgi:hypothetical protein
MSLSSELMMDEGGRKTADCALRRPLAAYGRKSSVTGAAHIVIQEGMEPKES